jgi:hypothetical protein
MQYFLTLFLVFLLLGCSSPRLTQTKTHILLKTEKTTFKTPATLLENRSFYFPPIHVTQSIKKLPDGNVVVYERAKCDSGYIFDKSIDILFFKIFQPTTSQLVFNKGNLYFYIASVDAKSSNYIIYNQNKKELHFLYPVPKELFLKLLKDVTQTNQNFLVNNFSAHTPQQIEFSKWSAKSVILDGLTKQTSGGRTHTR